MDGSFSLGSFDGSTDGKDGMLTAGRTCYLRISDLFW